MIEREEDKIIQQKMKSLLSGIKKPELSDEKRRELIARIYNVGEEKKHVTEFSPFKKAFSFSGAAAVFAVLIFMFNFFFSPLYPMVTNVKGTVKIYRASSNTWVFAQSEKLRLGKNDILKTFADGQADLVIPNIYHIRIKNDSEIKLAKSISRAANGNIGYSLDRGSAFAYYNKNRKLGRELGIETPQATASALGTDFVVESQAMINQTWVGVLDGTVKVTAIKEMGLNRESIGSVMVRAGEGTFVHQKMAPEKPAPLVENEIIKMEELYNIGTRPQVALLISTGTNRTRELLSAPILYVSSEKTGALPKKIEKVVDEFNKSVKNKSSGRNDASGIKELEDIVNNNPNSKYDVQFLLFIGSYYEFMGDDAKAISTFERVLSQYPKSGLASIAQCAIGMIYENRLKDYEKARSAYLKILSKYPSSPEAEEAALGIERLRRLQAASH